MARSNTTEAAPATPKPREAFDALAVPEDPAGAFVHKSISDACDLLDAKADVQARIQQSRDFLDYAHKSGQCTPEQDAWVTTYLPKRQRASKNGASADETTE